jgi:hypothetical protein
MPQPRAIKSPQGLRSAKNDSGTDIEAYRCVTEDVSEGTDSVEVQATANGSVLGITTETFTDADGVYRTYQCRDVALCEANAAITKGDLVMPATAGRVATRTGTNTIVGKAKTAAAAQGDIIEVELDLQTGA